MGVPHVSTECDEHHDLVRDFGGDRPTITVLCGSTRFGHTFQEQNLRLTMAGHIVLSIGCDTRSDHELWRDLDEAAVNELKNKLDELHKRKIDLADEVLVLNVGGYIGQSTRSEIMYAAKAGRPVRYLEEDSAPLAGDEYNGFTIDAFRIPGRPADARVVLRRGGELVREFEYPTYRVWTLLAHWRENVEVNPETHAPPTSIERKALDAAVVTTPDPSDFEGPWDRDRPPPF